MKQVPETIPALIGKSIASHGDKPVFSYVDGTPITFAKLGRLIKQVELLLAEHGVSPGDRVAVLSENRPEWPVAYLGVVGYGAVVTPILPDFHENEVANILEHSEAKLVFVSPRLRAKLDGAVALLEERSTAPTSLDIENLSIESSEQEPSPAASAREPGPDDLAAIIYTSGTTGSSKGVMLTHRNIVSNVIAASPIGGFEAGDCMLSLLPLSHSYECTLGCLTPAAAGAAVYYLDKPPSPTVLMPALAQVRPQQMLTVPLFIEKIFRNKIHPQLTGSAVKRMLYGVGPVRKLLHKVACKKLMQSFGGRLRFFGIGGAALAPDVEQFLRDGGFPYAIGYGLTETAPLIAGSSPADTYYRAIGPAIEGTQVRIAGKDSESGEGEIQVHGPNVMRGYFKDEERTAETFTADGWLRTGDLGFFDKEKRLYIRGRIKNMLLGPSGENIYPEEIEAVINSKPLVAESLVYQAGGKLVAKVHLNYEAMLAYAADHAEDLRDSAEELVELTRELMQNTASDLEERRSEEMTRLHEIASGFLDDLKQRVNQELNTFSRIAEFVEQPDPFEKTPTMKIKRYLYV